MPPRKSQLIIVANRLPVSPARSKDGDQWKRSPGGLVSALTPIVQKAGGAWIGWTGTTGPAPQPFEHDGIRHVPVPLSRSQLQSFYYGFCNGTLWPLYHDAIRQPEYHRRWWTPYVNINRRFANVTAEAADKGARVWIHDYHLQLVPALLREARPDLKVGFFLHIPFPPEELFGRLPWRRQILEGILGADVVGFQTQDDAKNFEDMALHYADARIVRGSLEIHGHKVRVAAFPISTDFHRFQSVA
jgi:trehalose 6-phosphate synthase